MTNLVKIHHKGQMTLPSRLRSAVGVAEGDLLEATVQRGKIVLTPKLVIDRSSFPNANNEYTSKQRRIIEARLARARKGPYYGPFDTAEEVVASMKQKLKKRAATKKVKRSQ
ncbi:MAG: AbrB/MazE/SpoVT family DNA-binding domain-containing protein [bacterium]|nr:AbrB/MazE/SpoVT family DNA-binding domain-containing protein [bacterium]